MTAGEAMEELLNAQIVLRNNHRLQAAMRASRLPAVKTLAQFDFAFQPSIKREQIESLHELGFLARGENVVFLGPPGVGKTHLAISLAIAVPKRCQHLDTPVPRWERDGGFLGDCAVRWRSGRRQFTCRWEPVAEPKRARMKPTLGNPNISNREFGNDVDRRVGRFQWRDVPPPRTAIRVARRGACDATRRNTCFRLAGAGRRCRGGGVLGHRPGPPPAGRPEDVGDRH